MRKALLICCLALSACGGSDRAPDDREEPAPKTAQETRLVVEVRPTGKDPVERRVVTELPAGVTAADFAPVPADTACAEIYGGPATARVDGVLDGKPLHTAFDLTNACEMQRWDRVSALLGPPPDGDPAVNP